MNIPWEDRNIICEQPVGSRGSWFFVQVGDDRYSVPPSWVAREVALGNARVRKMQAAKRVKGVKPMKYAKGSLLPKIYKTEQLAEEAAQALKSALALDYAVEWKVVRVIRPHGATAYERDTEQFIPARNLQGDYRWKLRRITG